MTNEEKVVLYEDDFGYAEPGAVFYPEALGPVTEILAELNRDDLLHPRSLNANLALYLDLIMGRFRSFHDTHRAAQAVYSAYRTDGQQYCAYLRSFWLAGGVLSTGFEGARPIKQLAFSASDRSFQRLINSTIPASVASLSFINIFELYPSGCENTEEAAEEMRRSTIPSFRLLSHNWRDIVREVVAGAKFIVFNDQTGTPGIGYELEVIQDAGMAPRTIVAGSSSNQPGFDQTEFYDVVDFADGARPSGRHPNTRLSEGVQALASDAFRQANVVQDLSDLKCWVVDRRLDIAEKRFQPQTLAGVPYKDYLPSSLASNWDILTKQFPKMITDWKTLEAKGEQGLSPSLDELTNALYTALAVFYVGVTLERYHEMALALSTVGMAHRSITGDKHIMAECYRHAEQCAEWDDDVELRTFLADARSRLNEERNS